MWSKPLQKLHKDLQARINGPELFGPCATVTRAWTALPAISQAHSQRMLDTAIPFLEARRKDILRVKQVNQEILLDKPAIYGFFENNCTLESNKSVIQSLT